MPEYRLVSTIGLCAGLRLTTIFQKVASSEPEVSILSPPTSDESDSSSRPATPPPSADTRHVAQITATSLMRILGVTTRISTTEVGTWWNDVVLLIDSLLSSSGVEPHISFCTLVLLERYARSTGKLFDKLDIYSLFVASLIIAAKIISPRRLVQWETIMKGTFVEGRVAWIQREVLITLEWDTLMLEIVDEVWAEYERAIEEGRGDPSRSSGWGLRGKAGSWTSSLTSTSTSEKGTSVSFQSSMLLSPLRGGVEGLPKVEMTKTTSSLWREYMPPDRPRWQRTELSQDTNQYMKTLDTSSSLLVTPKPQGRDPNPLKLRLSRMFKTNTK